MPVTSSNTNPWDSNGNGVLDLGDILTALQMFTQ